MQPQFPYSPDPYLLAYRTYKRYYEYREIGNQNKLFLIGIIFGNSKLSTKHTENLSKTNFARITPELIRELKQMDEYSNQAKFLATNKIDTEEQLNEFWKTTYEKLAPLKSKRENLWKKLKRAKNEDEKKLIENEIVEISKKISPLAEELKHCHNIQNRMKKIKKLELYQKLKQENQEFEKEKSKKTKNRER